jgi:hypothetical protein
MSLWLTIVVILVGSAVLAAVLTLGIRRLFRTRDRLLTGDGGSPALRALTATYGLLLAFMLGASLQSYQGAQQQTVSEADTVVSLNNLAGLLPGSASQRFRSSLECYASSVVYQEFPAMRSGSSAPLDDDSALIQLYRDVPAVSAQDGRSEATTQTVMQQLSSLTGQRDARIRSARTSLPTLLWVLIFGGGLIVMMAVAAITFVDRPWPQFVVLTAVSVVFLSAVFLVVTLERPFQSSTLGVSEGPMKSALVSVNAGLPRDLHRTC